VEDGVGGGGRGWKGDEDGDGQDLQLKPIGTAQREFHPVPENIWSNTATLTTPNASAIPSLPAPEKSAIFAAKPSNSDSP